MLFYIKKKIKSKAVFFLLLIFFNQLIMKLD